mgnify:CR=1 FL=1
MSNFTLTRRESEERGIYELQLTGHVGTAILTYEIKGAVMIVDHTGVPKSLGGRGIGTWLLSSLFFDAKREGRTIDPVCPFVKAKGERNPDWAKHLV